MAALLRMICLAVVIATMAHIADAGATFEIKLLSYKNPSGQEMNGHCCDSWLSSGCGSAPCDHDITFCVDAYREAPNDHFRNNLYHCTEYAAKSTGKITDQLNVNLDVGKIGHVTNPIVIKKPTWTGRMVLKVYVRDYDRWKLADKYSDVDKFISTLTPPQRFPSKRVAYFSHDYTIRGIRRNSPTSLVFQMKLYCDDNYYGKQCDVFCVGQDNQMTGHYTCDPDTGVHVCLPGWEEPAIACKIIANDCLGQNCNNGTCVDGLRKYTCDCPAGTTGDKCESDINECTSAPCDPTNSVQCVNTKSSYFCHCKPGFVGSSCQFNMCDNDIGCLNGGTCVGTVECICAPGFSGLNCGTDICDTKACQNGGKCNNGVCYCPRAFTGEYCEKQANPCKDVICPNGICKNGVCVNPCNARPCQNEGTCFFSLDATSYHCKCMPGYTDQNCSSSAKLVEVTPVPSDVDDQCKNVVCQNAGTCHAGTCRCPLGFTGENCEGIINYCKDIACMNGGTCYSNTGAFVCVCRDGYRGANCESQASAGACYGVSCQNGGRCISGSCMCLPGYGGELCEKGAGCNISPCKNGGSCYRSDYSFTCVCKLGWQGASCDRKVEAVVAGNPNTAEATEAQPMGYWVYIVVGVGVVFLILIILVVALLITKRRRQKEKAPTSTNHVNNTKDSFDNPVFQNHGVYENMDDEPDKPGYSYSAQNNINLSIVPRDKHVYSKQLPSDGNRPHIAERSLSYDGTQPAKGVNKGQGMSSVRKASVSSSTDSSDVYNATAGTASGYQYAKVDKNSKKGTKTRELKTPKHLEDRYQSMKELTMQNSLKG